MIARDGWSLIFVGLVITVIALWGSTRWDSVVLFIVGIVFALATVFTVYFLRDPDRSFVPQPDLLIAPADGTVVEIDTLDNHPFVGDSAVQVSIFLSVFNVHVQRVPTDGTIDYVHYNPGKFFAAYEDKASERNEQTEIGLTSTSGRKIAFKQIAGLIARRIVCHLDSGATAIAGERFGLIRYGSRVDLLLPPSTDLRVKVGDRMYGGETVVGFLAPIQESAEPAAIDEDSNGRL